MYHSINIGDKNTWDDWHLIPSTRPVFKQPTQKIKTLEIPGGNGVLDLSTALTGYPVYNNREGTLEFNVVNGYKPWYVLCSEIANYLSGQKFKIVLEDDKGFYYEGKFTLNEWKSDKSWSKIVFDYNLDPFKWSGISTTEDWYWDPFNFYSGVIVTDIFTDVPIESSGGEAHHETHIPLDPIYLGKAPVCPRFTFTTTAGYGGIVWLNYIDGSSKGPVYFEDGESYNADIVLDPTVEEIMVLARGNAGVTGTVSIDFRQGWL